jgi:hypothetical protein
MLNQNVNVEACKACADNYGVSQILLKAGITVRYWGELLTELLKSNEKLITI